MKNLLLVTGAGASHDVIPYKHGLANPYFKPPLTKKLLFSSQEDKEHPYVNECLQRHYLAAQVGLKFHGSRLIDADNEENSLERFLFELHENQATRYQYWSVPLYLYELFYNISYKYIMTSKGIPSNYLTLIDEINQSEYTQVIWINLNYDLFVDFAINVSSGIDLLNFGDYMNITTKSGVKIKYTKPHGSIDWFRKIILKNIIWEDIKLGKCPADFENELSPEVFTRVNALKSGSSFPDKWYPALLAPLGKYKPIYSAHLDEISRDLKETASVLCIGFNALDQDILNLIKENIPQIDNIKIVNGSTFAGEEAYSRMIRAHIKMPRIKSADSVYNGGFSSFLEEDIKRWVKW